MADNAAEFPPAHFLNRELSWLEFNQRVLDEALDDTVPLLERVKFFCIASSNLDEFFEVRVAGLKQQIESEAVGRSVDGLTASETFRAVNRRVRRMVARQFNCWRDELRPALAEKGIRFLTFEELGKADLGWIEEHYRTQVRPVLTPLGIDPAHPFPQLLNKSLNLIVRVEIELPDRRETRLAVVQVPRSLPRLVKLPHPGGRMNFVFLSHIIGRNLPDLFPGTRVLGHWQFRVTRNSELYIDEGDSPNLLKAVETELHNRRKGEAVRLEVELDCPPDIRAKLLEYLRLAEDDLHVIDGPVNPTRLVAVCEGDHSPELRDPPFVAPVTPALREPGSMFAAVRERDVLLHHPYDNFDSVVTFLEQAAADPRVLAIKQTLYRTGGDPRIIGALKEAVHNGKQVTAVVELKARFDEANNIAWSCRLEEAGVHVVYGLVGCKIHAKMTLVVRRDDDAIRRYVHLGTGNYNPTTARFYTDLGLLTCRPDFGEDATNLFNLLTGVCQFQGMRKFIVAPFNLRDRLAGLIRREAQHAARGLPARIIAKMNALVDPEIIRELYRASQTGVKMDLIVRGTCCLRPGVKGVSDNITVRSIVDRFLEHSRVFWFENACQPEAFIASADWMPRNLNRRIEVMFPVEDGNLRERVKSVLLDTALADNVKARLLQPDGSWRKPALKRGTAARRSQAAFIQIAVAEASKPSGSPRGAPARLRPRPRPGPRAG
ncbi:MAG: polyphosphate kinase 1 [Verrucomicrobia bacterium]|nr:polyphosphate kinase 1 [Verrucomicrobiota bacterium]